MWSLAIDDFIIQQELRFNISKWVFLSVYCPHCHPKRVNVAFLPRFISIYNLKWKEKLKRMNKKKWKILQVQWIREFRLALLPYLSWQCSWMFRSPTVLPSQYPFQWRTRRGASCLASNHGGWCCLNEGTTWISIILFHNRK